MIPGTLKQTTKKIGTTETATTGIRPIRPRRHLPSSSLRVPPLVVTLVTVFFFSGWYRNPPKTQDFRIFFFWWENTNLPTTPDTMKKEPENGWSGRSFSEIPGAKKSASNVKLLGCIFIRPFYSKFTFWKETVWTTPSFCKWFFTRCIIRDNDFIYRHAWSQRPSTNPMRFSIGRCLSTLQKSPNKNTYHSTKVTMSHAESLFSRKLDCSFPVG